MSQPADAAFIAIATITPLPEHRDAVRDALLAAVVRTHAEDVGCERYALHETPDGFVMIEKWADGAAVAAHGGGPAFAELKAAWDGKLAVPLSVQRLTPLPAGDPVLGAL